MAVENYYLASKAYAYPSANANDGGEDNTEDNLRMITDKFAIRNFVILRMSPKGAGEKYFTPHYHESNPKGISLDAGECSINGYYFNLESTVIATTDSSGTTILKPNTDYVIALRIYKDGSGNLRGDGQSLIYPNNGKLESRAVTAGVYTQSEIDSFDPQLTLPFATFTSDSNGDPPPTKTGNTYNYTMIKYRFAFIDMQMIINESGQSIEEWTLYQLERLDHLHHYDKPEDTSPTSTLQLNNSSLICTVVDESSTLSFDIVEIEKRTHVAPEGQSTSLAEYHTDNAAGTWNGSSTLLARADHDHDGRYIYRRSLSGTPYTDQQSIGTCLIIQPYTDSASNTSNMLDVYGSATIRSSLQINGSGNQPDDSLLSIGGDSVSIGKSHANFSRFLQANPQTVKMVVDNTVTITAGNGIVMTNPVTMKSSLSEVHGITNTGNITNSGKVTTATFQATGNATVGGSLTVTGNITGAKVYNAVWNDYADAVLRKEGQIIEPGDVICKSPDSEGYELSTLENRKLVVGVCTDTYGHLLGGDKGKSLEENLEKYVPIAVAGNVRAKVQGRVSPGDLIVVSKTPGVGEAADQLVRPAPGTIIGKALERKDSLGVNRILIQVMLA